MIDTDKYEGHMVDYFFEGSNFDLKHLTMYDIHGNEIAVLESENKELMGGAVFVSPTIELWYDAPLLLAEVKRLRAFIDKLYAKDPSFVDFVWEEGDPQRDDWGDDE
jgi:hypothetical protein|tara:strand:- start:610 stop:930 length:321 start_codon:yes stop_codon:yes gene_type:complete